MSKLVIVESPAKCSKIASFLGADYKVIASMGHIRALDETLDSIGIDRDFEPRFIFMKEKSKAIAALKDAAAGVSEVYLAADDDREGEAIAYSVALLLKLPLKTTKRAIFHEITKEAVCRAVAQPRTLDMNRVYAQQARAMLDMMIGFTISPLLWKHVARGLSAGRCQTPALRFVVEREDQVAGHTAETSWIVKGSWLASGKSFEANLTDELADEESASNYLENKSADIESAVTSTVTRPWTENPPLPLITSTLQQAASSMYHSNPKNTMKVAQRLYEAGHITYMRTDKAILCAEAIQQAQDLVKEKYGAPYCSHTTTPTTIESKKPAKKGAAAEPKAQEAHEAIRPTHFEQEVLAGDEWTPLDRNIYKLIRNRALQSVMAPAKGETVTVKFASKSDSEDGLEWSATGRKTTFEGWKVIGLVQPNDDCDSEHDVADSFALLSSLKVGAKVTWTNMETQPHITKATPRYTEATLVKALEERGIGRPSTFASLLDAIIEKKYVEKRNIEGTKITLNKYSITPHTSISKSSFQRNQGAEKDRLVPTELGRQMLTFALKYFDDLFDFGFTATLEARLDHVADGSEEWKSLLKDTWTSYQERVATLSKVTGGPAQSTTVKDLGDGLKAQITKSGPLLIQEATDQKAKFYGWPLGATFTDITPEIARAHIAAQAAAIPTVGSYEGDPITKHKGQYGSYVKWRDLNISIKAEDTEESIIEKIKAKQIAAPVAQATTVGPFTFKTGPYGPYMYKTELKTKKFVSVPATIDVAKLTIREADEIYKRGLEAKTEAAKKGAKFAAIRAAKGQHY